MYVYLYRVEATYRGGSAFEWSSPKVGSRCKAILFLAQDVDHPQPQKAEAELVELGFFDFLLGEGKPIYVEALNDSTMRPFIKHYEGAMSEGSSLIWYPDPS